MAMRGAAIGLFRSLPRTGPDRWPLGFKLETPPLHPVLYSTTLQGFGPAHAEKMRDFAHAQAVIALVRDGFHPDSRGGAFVCATTARPSSTTR